MFKKIICFRGQKLQILSSFIVTLGIFSFSLGHLWPSPAIPKLLLPDKESKTIQITTDEGSWIASLEMITIPFASFMTIYLANYFGTKNILQLAPVPLVASWILVIYANHVYYVYVARCLVGFSEAFFYNCAPLYIAEISNPKIRGRLIFGLSIMFSLGGCFVYFFGYKLSIEFFAILSILPAIVYFFLILCMPQSPYYHIENEKYSSAKKSLEILEDKLLTNDEFEAFKKRVEIEQSNKGSLTELFQNKVSLESLKIVVILMFFQNWVGAATITTYLHYILQESGVNVEWTALVFAINTAVSSLCSSHLVDILGRRPLVLCSITGAGFFMTTLGAIICAKENNFFVPGPHFQWSITIVLMLYVFSLNLGIVSTPFLLAGEIFPTNLKNYGVSFILVMYGVCGFLTNKMFQFFTDNFGMYYVFFCFGLCACFGVCYVYYCLPETRNKSLFEIQIMLKTKSTNKKDNCDIVI